jgi:hypothetical protein
MAQIDLKVGILTHIPTAFTPGLTVAWVPAFAGMRRAGLATLAFREMRRAAKARSGPDSPTRPALRAVHPPHEGEGLALAAPSYCAGVETGLPGSASSTLGPGPPGSAYGRPEGMLQLR